MRRALLGATLLVLAVPGLAQAATLSVERAEQAALVEVQQKTAQENMGTAAQVGSCERRGARTVRCAVTWEYVERFDGREDVSCEETNSECSQDEDRRWVGERRKCTANVTVRYVSPRLTRVSAVLTGQQCTPFFDQAPTAG